MTYCSSRQKVFQYQCIREFLFFWGGGGEVAQIFLNIYGEKNTTENIHKTVSFQISSHFSNKNTSLLRNRSVKIFIDINHCLIVVRVIVFKIFPIIYIFLNFLKQGYIAVLSKRSFNTSAYVKQLSEIADFYREVQEEKKCSKNR